MLNVSKNQRPKLHWKLNVLNAQALAVQTAKMDTLSLMGAQTPTAQALLRWFSATTWLTKDFSQFKAVSWIKPQVFYLRRNIFPGTTT